MKLYQIETTPLTDHTIDWHTSEYVKRYAKAQRDGEDWDGTLFAPGESTIWDPQPGEFHLSSVAEDGNWIKLCGPNVHKMHGRRIRVTIEDASDPAEEPAVQGIRDRAPEVVAEYVDKWYRSRKRDGDDEWCKAMRHGWAQVIAALTGQPFRIVNKALERNEL